MATHSSTLAGKSHGLRSLVGYSPWGRKESDTTERLHFHFSLSCIGGGNGNPLQCSCLENPRDGRAWWAAVYGVAESQTRLKQLSSRSSSSCYITCQSALSLCPFAFFFIDWWWVQALFCTGHNQEETGGIKRGKPRGMGRTTSLGVESITG